MKHSAGVQLILNTIAELKEGESRTVEVGMSFSVRQSARKILTREERGGNIVMSLCGTAIVVYRKPRSYTQKLEDMLRKVMLSVEDENLYDEIMNLLEVK